MSFHKTNPDMEWTVPEVYYFRYFSLTTDSLNIFKVKNNLCNNLKLIRTVVSTRQLNVFDMILLA